MAKGKHIKASNLKEINKSLFGFLAFISLTSFWPVTTELHGVVLSIIRLLSSMALLAATVSLVLWSARVRSVDHSGGLYWIIVVLMYIYALTLASVYGGLKYYSEYPQYAVLALLSIIQIAGILVFSQGEIRGKKLALRPYSLYFKASILLLFIAGGISLLPFPSIVYEWEVITNYSQGFSKFFGLASLFFFSRLLTKRSSVSNFTFFLISLMLSLLGAGRGEIAFLLLILLVQIFHNSLRALIGIIMGAMAVTFLPMVSSLSSGVAGSALVARLARLDSGAADRFHILTDAMNLFTQSPQCMLTGCGFNYYQAANGFAFGRYPHNSVLEMIVTFGLPISAGLLLFVGIGLFSVIKIIITRPESSFFSSAYLYLFFISLKSDSLTILGLPLICGLAVIGANRLTSILKKVNTEKPRDQSMIPRFKTQKTIDKVLSS
jgi:hypothetical protein